MKSLFAFIKKEILESVRSGKITILIILFVLFGIMNPAIAKLIPWLVKMTADSLSKTGINIIDIQVNALTSWTQFFKNIPMALLAFILLYNNIFTKEYQTGTLILMLTKGLLRCKVILAKSALLLTFWTLCYWLCFGITYGYNSYFWDNNIASNLLIAGVCWWLFGLWVVCLLVFFSILFSNATGVLLGTACSILLSFLIGYIPKIGKFMPTILMNSSSLLTGVETVNSYGKSVFVTLLFCITCFAIGIPVFNKKQIG